MLALLGATVDFQTRLAAECSDAAVVALDLCADDLDGLKNWFQNPVPADPSRRNLFHSTSTNLLDWIPKEPHPIGSFLGRNVIDGALAHEDGFFYIGFKDRNQQRFYVSRARATSYTGACPGTCGN